MIKVPFCYERSCKHLLGIKTGKEESDERSVCKAFPDGIPDEIVDGTNLHTEVYPNQKGDFLFEKGEMPEDEEGD